jgi:iron complex outermembrane receptor protein
MQSVYRRSTILAHAVSAVLFTAATIAPIYVWAQESASTEPATEAVATDETTTSPAADESSGTTAAAETTATETSDAAPEPATTEAAASGGDVTSLSDLEVTEDPLRALTNEPSATSFGFSKAPLETPRSVSFLSEEQMNLFGVSTVQDLVRVVPGAYTTTRYGLQGGINVRAVTADQYFRGMKRLSLQGHVRTVLSAMDSIEVVKGPPSPLYGMGRIGGYSNLIPKSSRAKTGKYLVQSKGFLEGTGGSYNKSEVQFGVGGPMKVGSKEGGYYVFALAENSDSYVEQVSAKQKFLQATTSIDEFIGPFRLEVGGQLQQSITSGAYMNRATQSLIDHGTYITGEPLANLDVNADGGVGYLETYTASPVTGGISTSNQALAQRITPSFDTNGRVHFQPMTGVPQTMLNYLTAHPEVNCSMANYMRTLPAAPTLPGTTRQLPVGFVLNPCTAGTTKVDYRRNGSFEREQNGKQNLLYLDLIYDTNPDFTVKNQLFYDRLDTFKDSNLPYGEKQDIHAFEEKLTVTKRVPDEWLPSWMRVNSLGSVNYRDTRGNIRSSSGDFDYRQDVMRGTGHLYSNTIFWNQLNDQTYLTGADDTGNRTSAIQEMGLGILFDIDLGRKTNVLVGGRFDYAEARAQDFPDFLPTAGRSPTIPTGLTATQTMDAQLTAMRACDALAANAAAAAGATPESSTIVGQTIPVAASCPGAYMVPGKLVKGYDHGPSFSISLSQQLPLGMRPYVTYARSSLTLDGSNNIIQPTVVAQPAGFIGEAELREVGLKNSWFNNKLIVTFAHYQQTRNDVRTPDDPGAAADVSSTEYKGVEADFKWAPARNIYVGGYVLTQKGRYTVDSGFNAEVDGRALGFQDIVDPATGKVYPAEAFLYGGRFSVAVPANQPQFRDRTGDPEVQAGLNATYRFNNGLGFLLSSNYFEAVWADRLKTVRLPSAITVDAGVSWDSQTWHIKGSIYNLLDERYWQARNADTNPFIVTAKPGTTWELMLKHDF